MIWGDGQSLFRKNPAVAAAVHRRTLSQAVVVFARGGGTTGIGFAIPRGIVEAVPTTGRNRGPARGV